MSGVAAPSTVNHAVFVGGAVRAGAKRTRGNRTSRLDHVAFDRDRTGRHLHIWMGRGCQQIIARTWSQLGKRAKGSPTQMMECVGVSCFDPAGEPEEELAAAPEEVLLLGADLVQLAGSPRSAPSRILAAVRALAV